MVDEQAILGESAARISALIRSRDLATPVEHLGRWKVRDVVAHLGGVHRWATRIVAARSMDGPGFQKSKLDGDALCDWFDEGVQDLLAVFRNNDPRDPCPNFNPGSDKTVGWWSLRQMHETMVHRWDVEQALDCVTSLDPAASAECIDEYLDVFIRTRGKQTLTSPLVLSTTRPSRAWTLVPAAKAGRVDVAAGRDSSITTELRGKPGDLLLAVWRRLSIDDAGLVVIGDAQLAASLMGPT